MGINVVGIFGRCGAVQGDWNLDVPVEAVRNRLMRLCGRDGSGSMPMVRSIYPSFLGMLILVTLLDALLIFAAVLGGVNAFFDSGGLLLTVLLDVVSGFLLIGGAVEFGLGFLFLLLGDGRGELD